MAFLRSTVRCSTHLRRLLNSEEVYLTRHIVAFNSTTPEKRRVDPLDISFSDTHAAFKSKTTWELVRALFVYVVCSFESLVAVNDKVNFLTKERLEFAGMNKRKETEKRNLI